MNKLFYVVGATVLVVGFQNCTQTNFSSQNGGSSYLAALGGDVPGNGDVGTGTTSPGVGTGTTSPGVGTGTTSPGVGTGTTSPVTTPVVCQDDDHGYGHQHSMWMDSSSVTLGQASESCHSMHDSDCEQDRDSQYVACILKQNGKSLKLGLVQNSLDGVTSTAESVCVTKAECLGDVAKAFEVVGAYERGYCDHNPHVKRLTDAEVKTLLGVQ